jgi:hypothetical protein
MSKPVTVIVAGMPLTYAAAGMPVAIRRDVQSIFELGSSEVHYIPGKTVTVLKLEQVGLGVPRSNVERNVQ